MPTCPLSTCSRKIRRRRRQTLTNTPFQIDLAMSGLTTVVPADRTILDVLDDAGVITVSSCRDGICGTCEVGVVSGEVDHRDTVLTPETGRERIHDDLRIPLHQWTTGCWSCDLGADRGCRRRRRRDDGEQSAPLYVADGCIGAESPGRPDEVVDASDCVVTAGLINAHHHLLQSAFRTLPGTRFAMMSDWLRQMSAAYGCLRSIRNFPPPPRPGWDWPSPYCAV